MASASPAAASFTGTLIPGLTDDISTVILASLPLPHQSRLRSTSRPWLSLLSPSTLLPLRRRLTLPSFSLLCLFPSDPSLTPPLLFDPLSLAWLPLPRLPCSPHFYSLSHFRPLFLSPHLYIIGGSVFDARNYPLGHPSPTPAVYRLDLSAAASPSSMEWERLLDMNSPRGSFACTGLGGSILVAGGGSRHAVFPSQGSRISSVERYDVAIGEWKDLERLPKYRAGCVGFLKKGEREDEFWVMGGYGEYTTLSRVVPADVYYRDAVVLGLKSGGWRETGEMWGGGERERARLGPVAVLNGEDGRAQQVFMLDSNEIFRYNFSLNSWQRETSLRKKIPDNESCGFTAMNGDIYVLTSVLKSDGSDFRRPYKRRPTLEIQVYKIDKRKWRVFTTHPPLFQPVDFKTASVCTIPI